MNWYNNRPCISRNELVNLGILSADSYKWYLHARKIHRARRACKGTSALVYYDNMPGELKRKVKRVLGDDVREQAKRSILEEYLEWDTVAEDFYAKHTYENGKHIKEKKQRQYAANASVLNAIIEIMNDKAANRKSMGGTGAVNNAPGGFWDTIRAAIGAIQVEWGCKLPCSERNLRSIINRYKSAEGKEKYKILISKKDNNQNAGKLKQSEQESILREMLRHPNNMSNEYTAYCYNLIAKYRGWRSISAGTVANRRIEWDLTTMIGRRGERVFDNNLAMQVKRSKPTYPTMYWTIDGWEVELYYQKNTTNSKGHSITTYTNRLTMIVVLDTYNNYPLGITVGEKETAHLIQRAVLNALQHTKELFGAYHRPHQVQSDNFAKKQMPRFLERLGVKYTPAKVGNAKSKTIEPWFKFYNNKHCKPHINYSGYGVTARKENQPNAEFKNKYKHLFPDMEGVVNQILEGIIQERKELGEDYVNRFKKLDPHYKLTWNTEQYLYNVGMYNERTIKLRGEGIRLQVNKQEYNYDSFDTDFRRNAHQDWVIKYDPSDMRHVLAQNTDGTLRFLLTEKHIQPMALADRKEGDGEALEKINRFNKTLKEEIMEQVIDDSKTVRQMRIEHPEISDSLHKMLITDSLGQHKKHKQKSNIKKKLMQIQDKEEKKLVKAKCQKVQDRQTRQEQYWDDKLDDYINDYLE